MNHTALVSMLSCISLVLLTPSLAQAGTFSPASGQFVPNQVLIEFKPNTPISERNQTAQSYGARSIQTLERAQNWSIANLPAGQSVEQAVSMYANHPSVASVQPNYIYHTMATPAPLLDPQYSQQWAVKNTGQTITTGTYAPTAGTAGDDMNLEAAWNVQTDCSAIIVAVVDTGINYNSADLSANMWNGGVAYPWHGWNFVGTGSNDPMDYHGHGTHVAGTIGAVGGDGIGITGVCWKASIMAVRALDITGTGTTASVIQSMDFAIANGAKIINMSLGGAGGFDQAYSNAITRALNANVLVVVAAGNSGLNNDITPNWPCNFTQPNLICVAALDQNFALASFSNWGASSVDVGAPGTNILSTWNGLHTPISDPLNAGTGGGWTLSTTTTGGWGNDAAHPGWLFDPVPWGIASYNAGTDDRAYKTFSLAGANAATLTAYAAINVKSGDYFNINIKAAGGDPFVTGTQISSATNTKTGVTAYLGQFDISGCISATCSIGFQLASTATLPKDIGVGINTFVLDAITLNNTSYNTINGTSMATPQVTGVAALVWAHNPLFTYAEVANAIKNSGRSIPALAGKTTSGKAVDAMRALAYINPPSGVAAAVAH